MKSDEFGESLAELRQRGLLRELRTVAVREDGGVEFSGERLINFASNDYLGLARHPALIEAAREALGRFGAGSGASRLITGTHPPHRALEERLAEFEGTEAALTFSSGYAAALGVIPALVGPEDCVIADKLSHACLVDGIRLSGATMRVFPHNHLGKLESHLRWARGKFPNGRLLVVTESVFSMDGDAAPLCQIVELKDSFGAMLLVDEAHATGILGPGGRGLAAALGLQDRIEVRMGTFSKAIGASGGFVAGGRSLIAWLINRARSFIYSTAPPPAAAAAAEQGLILIASEEGETLRRALAARVAQLEDGLPERFKREGGAGAIFPFIIGSEAEAVDAAAMARERGMLVPAVRYPTVARGRARLRATLSACHTEAQVERLIAFARHLDCSLAAADEEAEDGAE